MAQKKIAMLGTACISFVLCILSAGLLWAGADVRVNQDPGFLLQNEASITINPSMPGNLVVAYNEDPSGPGGMGQGIGISYTFDGGVMWGDTHVAEVWNIEGDPSVDADLNGTIFAGFMSYNGFFTDTNGIYVASSNDGGVTWSTPVMVDLHLNSPPNPGPFTDKCFLCVDNNPGSPNVGNVYITWQRDNINGVNSDVYFSASYNGGVSFTAPQRISDLAPTVSQCVGQVPKAAPNGDVYVVWGDFPLSGHTTGYLFFDKSTNGGTTWGTNVLIDSFLVVPRFPNAPSNNSFYVRSYPTLGVDPQNSNDVYVAVAADPDGIGGPDDGDIFLWASHDGGATWGLPVLVNDDGLPCGQFQPWLDVRWDGAIDIVWLDRRVDFNDEDFEVMFARSTDGGNIFSPNIPVSDTIIPLLPDPNGWMGEYIGIDVDSATAYIAWTDTRLGDRDIYFDAFSPPTGTPMVRTHRQAPKVFSLSQNYPNPFRNSTIIQYALPENCHVKLEVYNTAGQRVTVLVDREERAGYRSVRLDTNLMSPGVYFYRLSTTGFVVSKKLIVIR